MIIKEIVKCIPLAYERMPAAEFIERIQNIVTEASTTHQDIRVDVDADGEIEVWGERPETEAEVEWRLENDRINKERMEELDRRLKAQVATPSGMGPTGPTGPIGMTGPIGPSGHQDPAGTLGPEESIVDEQEYCLVQDDDTHWYICRADKLDEVSEYFEAVTSYWDNQEYEDNEEEPMMPGDLFMIGGCPSLVCFKQFRIGQWKNTA